jgi:DNA topoisomerase IA
MSGSQTTIPFLKKDAIIPIEVGQVFVGRLNDLLYDLIAQKTTEELEQLREVYEKKQKPETWMENIVLIQALLTDLHNKASELGFIEMKPVGDVTL